jgi:hypothetical protein
MKCNKCGYDFSGDPAHVCLDAPLDHVLRSAILRSSKVIKPPQREPLTEEELRIEFGKLYPNDLGILELAENNKDFAIKAIGARHRWAAFKAGARAIEAKLKETP